MIVFGGKEGRKEKNNQSWDSGYFRLCKREHVLDWHQGTGVFIFPFFPKKKKGRGFDGSSLFLSTYIFLLSLFFLWLVAV